MRKRRQIAVFSFSFVDVLATTVGVLIFVLLTAVLNVSGVVTRSQWRQDALDAELKHRDAELGARTTRSVYRRMSRRLEMARMSLADSSEAVRDAQTASSENRRLQAENDTLRAQVDRLTARRDRQRRQQAAITREGRGTGSRCRLPLAVGGAAAVPVHVDCRKEGLVILGTDIVGGRADRTSCPRRRIADEHGVFRHLVERVGGRKLMPDRQVVVLWVRPGGIETATKAIKLARAAGAPLGWEPADSDWEF